MCCWQASTSLNTGRSTVAWASRAAMSAVLGTSAREVLRCKGSTKQIYNAMADEHNNAGRAGSMCVCVRCLVR
jgi:hypothetical protein